MADEPSLSAQADAVEVDALNLRGDIRTIKGLEARGKRPIGESIIKEQRLPALEAAARTVRKLADEEAQAKTQATAAVDLRGQLAGWTP